MKNAAIFTIFNLVLTLIITNTATATSENQADILPDITLSTPQNSSHIKYLGLTGEPGTPFKLNEIKADILMIELFSMYCPYCQNAAPVVNELYEKMEKIKRPDLNLVIIGIGANNTELEVDTFRQGFDIQFPLFADKDMAIYKILEGKGTPGFIGCKEDENSKSVIFYRKSGGFTDADAFLDELLKKAELN